MDPMVLAESSSLTAHLYVLRLGTACLTLTKLGRFIPLWDIHGLHVELGHD
jgi:hypothetical protein